MARELDRIIAWRGRPEAVLSDNGTELTSNAILSWADERRIAWRYIQPGKPVQNAFAESFNARLRDEVSERDAVPIARRCSTADRSLAIRLQSPPPALEARLADAGRLRCVLAAERRP
nr:integrase core domain-containing protein [Hyphomicrobium sp. CS1GBMeth3]